MNNKVDEQMENVDGQGMKEEWVKELIKGMNILVTKQANLKERVIKLEAQMSAVDYILAGKDKVVKAVGDVQDKMYRLSKDVVDKLKPKE